MVKIEVATAYIINQPYSVRRQLAAEKAVFVRLPGYLSHVRHLAE